MADNEKEGEGTISRGVDWEVVSLTASTYAAAPSPQELDSVARSTEKEKNEDKNSSGALFMSDHFVFPPGEHENLPIETEVSEAHTETEAHDVSSYGQDEDIGNTQFNEELRRVQYFEGGSSLSSHDLGYKEGEGYQSLNLEEQGMFDELEFAALHAEANKNGNPYEPENSSQENMESRGKRVKQKEDDKDDGSNLPSQAWWKRHAVALYRHAKEANTFWSIVVAAAVMGLVILGQRWQRDKLQLQQLKLQFGFGDERMSRMLGPIGRFKDILVGGHHRSPMIRGIGIATDL